MHELFDSVLRLQDKHQCATINVVLSGYTVSNAPAGFPRQITLPFSVCWYKHNGQAKATFDFGSCGVGAGGPSNFFFCAGVWLTSQPAGGCARA